MADTRIKDLSRTATEADLTSENYLALDGNDGTKKLPADLIPTVSSLGLIAAEELLVEQGSFNLVNGGAVSHTYRLRSVGLVAGFGKIIAPKNLKITCVLYYDENGIFHSKEEFYPFRKEVSFGLEGYFARFIFGINDSTPITIADFYTLFGLESVSRNLDNFKKDNLYTLESDLYDVKPRRTDQSYNSSVPMTLVKQDGFVSYVIDVKIGDVLVITGSGGESFRLWAFVSSDNRMLLNTGTNAVASNLMIVSKYNGKFVVNFKTNSAYSLQFSKNRNNEINGIIGSVAEANRKIYSLVDKVASFEEHEGTRFVVSEKSVFDFFLNGAASQIIEHTNANLLPPTYSTSSQTISGITFTKQNDYSIKAVGTASSASHFKIVGDGNRLPLPAGKYVLKGAPGVTGCRLTIGITGIGEKYENGNTLEFEVEEDTTYYLFCTVLNGNQVDVVFRPILMRSDAVVSDFIAPQKETITLTGENNKVSLYDEVNIFTSSSAFTSIFNSIKRFEVNLKEYAKGDGVTDDTSNIQIALNAAAGKKLIVPAGTYLFSKTLSIPNGTTVEGEGAASIFKLANTFNLSSVAWRTGNAAYWKPLILLDGNSDSITMKNLVLEGQTSEYKDENEAGILVMGKNHIIEGVEVRNVNFFYDGFLNRSCLCPAWGIAVFNADGIIVNNCHSYNHGYESIGVESSSNVVIQNCRIGDGCQTRLQIHRYAKNVRVENNTIYKIAMNNLYLTMDADQDKAMEKIIIKGNTIDGSITLVAGGENDVVFSGNIVYGQMSHQHPSYFNSNWVIANNHIQRMVLRMDNAIIIGNFMRGSNTADYTIDVTGNNVIATNTENLLLQGSVRITAH